jgi:acetyltransferase
VTAEDLRLRFFASMREVSHGLLDKLIHYDPDRAMAFIAVDEQSQKMLGVVRLHDDTGGENAEFAILVRSRLKGHGVGWLLMKRMIEFSKHKDLKTCEAKCCQRIPPCLPCVPNSAFTLPTIRTISACRL